MFGKYTKDQLEAANLATTWNTFAQDGKKGVCSGLTYPPLSG
jgi:hypothetical protein